MGDNSALLEGTWLSSAYSIFVVQNDVDLINRMNWVALIFTSILGIYGLIQPSPYGKFSKSWTGPTINAKLGWTLQEFPAWLFPFLLIFSTQVQWRNSVPNVILVVLFTAHYIQRSLIYPQRLKSAAKPVPIFSSILCGIIICAFNGLYQGHFLLNVQKIELSYSFYPGVLIFITGMVLNIYHDGIMLSLRSKRTDEERQSSEYKIPTGGLFEYVSGANYMGEILEWWGFALASLKIPQLVFAIFTSVFLGIRAWHQHQYYRKTFGDSYPSRRKAVVPFII